jgi:N-acetylglucosamine-6-phosphate deacetylase
MSKFRLHNGKLITDKILSGMDLLINGSVIEGLIPSAQQVSADYQVLDCTGKYISAGFVDIHQHGGGGNDYMDDDPDAYFNASAAHLAHGTTSVMPTLLSADTGATLRAVKAYLKALEDPRIKSNLIGIHMEGPYISPEQAGAQKPEHIREFDPKEYQKIYDTAQGNIKRWSVAPEVSGAAEFAEFARENGIALSIAHSNADFDTVMKAFEQGYRQITHFYSCVSTITRRNGFRVPGILEAGYFLDDMDVEIIADGCHIPKTLLQYVCKFKKHDRVALVTDAMRAAGQDVKESFLGSMDDPLPVVIEDGVAKMLDRKAFAGSVATADVLVRNIVNCGVPLQDAVAMMTVNPLRMTGLNLKKGKLESGYDADICVFDEDIQVCNVFTMGNLVK